MLSVVPGRKLPAGKYKVKAKYENRFQNESCESKEFEVVVPCPPESIK